MILFVVPTSDVTCSGNRIGCRAAVATIREMPKRIYDPAVVRGLLAEREPRGLSFWMPSLCLSRNQVPT